MRLRLGLLSVLAALAAGCGTDAKQNATPAPAAKTCTPAVRTLGTPTTAFAAVAQKRLRAYRTPGGEPVARFGTTNVNGVPTVFGVLGARYARNCTVDWFRVQLPVKPNGAVGWVRAADVGVAKLHTRILVDVSARKLTFFRDGKAALTTTVAVGAPSTPTPTGRYYVNQRLIPSNTAGPFGPAALGVSAFSNVLTGWTQGGPIAIHGTNDPSSIGHNVSNGCIRVRNEVLRRLFKQVLAGTPVIIRA
jgi:lipoprotein-anchoring transpeptidase ErfK/SrfK